MGYALEKEDTFPAPPTRSTGGIHRRLHINIHYYILYTFAHTHTTYVCIYIYILCIYTYTTYIIYIYVYKGFRLGIALGSGPRSSFNLSGSQFGGHPRAAGVFPAILCSGSTGLAANTFAFPVALLRPPSTSTWTSAGIGDSLSLQLWLGDWLCLDHPHLVWDCA